MSVASGGSSAQLSATSSRESAIGHLKKRAKAKEGGEAENDLLEDKQSIQDFCFMCISTLSAEKPFLADWRINLAKIVLEGLTGFFVVFNPLVQGWDIDYKNWFWQIISWSTYHSAVAVNREYKVYTNVMYLHVAIVAILLAGLLALALTVNKVHKSRKLQKWVKVLHFCSDVVFTVSFMTIFSVFTFMFNCDFQSNNNGGTNMHLHYRDVDCSEVPHLAHMVVGGIFALILGIMACIMAVADTEHSPIGRAWLASPSMVTRMKIVVTKMVIIICAVGINQPRRAPTIIVWLAALYTWWLYFRQMPFYNNWVNISISSMWLGIAYTASLLMVLSWDHRNGDPDFHYWMTWNVLKGIFPVMVGGACCHYAFIQYKMYWTKKFVDPPSNVALRKIFKFEYPEDVEIMSRSMRKFDRDGAVDMQAVELGATILQAGMQYFPSSPSLVIQYAALLLEVRHEGPLTRTQLQNAMKLRPDLLDKYRIFVISQRTKRMKDAADGTMDLQSYVEFKRNYRMLARVHKEALQAQRDFWKLFMRSKTQDATVKQALQDLAASSSRAQMVYSKIMERYPNNGKVLKCYGKFLEEVKNDIAGATKFYSEGNRLGSTDAIMNMDFDLASKKKSDFLVSMDMHEDAVIVIDAVGTILMISQGTTAMFGYTKIELENANISMLMPQPFSQRHPSYLQRYTSTMDPHIIDKVQEVVALHKEKFVFPTELGVTRLSGTGSDCVFLGVMKAMPVSMENVRVWVAPNGVILCADQQFSGLLGYPSEALVGMSIFNLLDCPAVGEAFNEQCKSADPEDFVQQRIKTTARFVGKYLPPVPCSITVKLGGTQTERIFVWNVKRTDRNDEMTMVCDTHGTITFATWDVAALLGMSTRKLVGTKLDTLLPPPYNSMHAKWLQETPSVIPSSSCRAGVVVNLLNSSHVLVPVRIKVHQMEDQGRTLHVVRLTRAAPNALVEEKRVSLTCNLLGTIEDIEPTESQLFGWPAMEMKGRHIADVVDAFAIWRQKIADRYHEGDLERCMADASSGGTKLLLLALMDQEYARPGGSYRVSVKPPDTDFATAIAAAQNTQHQGATLHELLHNAANAAKIRAARPAVMLPEVVEVDGVPAVKVHLFKQESLTGYLEMDPNLNIRKADMWAGLVLGWPTTMLTSQKLHNLLHVPPSCRWEELMGIKAQMGGLKRVNRGTVTAPRKFTASHPDGGTMRITIQGVSKSEGLGSKNRIEATLHPDVAFKGEPSEIFQILELENEHGNTNADSITQGRDAGNQANRASLLGRAESGRHSRRGSLMGKAGGGAGGRRGSSSSGTGNAFAHRMKLEKSGSGRALLGDVDEEEEGEGDEEELQKRDSHGDSGSSGELDGEGVMSGSMGSGEGDGQGGQEDGEDGLPGRPAPRISMMGAMMQGSDDEEDDEDTGKKKENKPSDFVAQWVKTVANLGDRPETPNSSAGDPEGADQQTTSRAMPALMAIDENNEATGGREQGEWPHHLEMRGSPLGSKRRSSGMGDGFGKSGEEGVEPPDARASIDLPPPGEDWEREVADMPDEAAEIALAKKAKGKRPGNKPLAAEGDQPSQPGDEGRSESSGGDGGTETDGQSVTSGNSAHDEILIDFRRGRLLKKLVKLVKGPSLMEPLERLDMGTLRVLAGVLAVHIVCFAVIMVLFAEKAEDMMMIQRHALTIQSFERMRFRAVQAKFCARDVVGAGLSFPDDNMCELARDPSKITATLLDSVDEFSVDHHDTYLGLDGRVAKLKSPKARALWDDASVDVMMYYDMVPPEVKNVKMGIWEFGNRMAYASREIAVAIRKKLSDISDTPAYQFITQRENKGEKLFEAYLESLRHLAMFTWRDTDETGQGVIAILVVQAILVLTLLHMYQLKLVVDVERARLGNILALVGLPGPILRIMHAKPVNILDDDSDDEADDEEDGDKKLARAERKEEERRCQEEELKQKQQEAKAELKGGDTDETDKVDDEDDGDEKAGKDQFGGMAISGPSKKSARGAGLETTPARRFLQLQKVLYFNGKALTTSWERTLRLVLPLFLWQLAVLIVFAVTTTQVEELKDPLASLFMQMRVNAWFGHVRSHALKLVADLGPNKPLWREILQEDVSVLESNYEVLLYGNGGQTSHDFPFPVPPAAFASTEFSGLYFREKMCFREEGQCLNEEHRFYESAHNGLDALMRRFITEAKLLSMDEEQDANFLSPRFDFIYQLGMFDLADGLTEAANVFTDFAIARLKAIQEIHIALLIVTLVLAVGYVYWVTKPYVAGIKREASYVAGLLSHTPKELDVTSHLKGALKV